jgi:phage FluMu protein Com
MTTPARPVVLDDVRCPRCKKLLAKIEPGALRTGKLIEYKCPGCNAYRTDIGDEHDSQ